MSGKTEAELVQAAQRLRPQGKFDGNAHSRVSWVVTPEEEKDRCAVATVRATVEATVVLPRWTNPSEGPESVRLWWALYVRAVERFEEASVQRVVALAEAIEKAIRELPAARDCRELQARTDAAGSAILVAARKKANPDGVRPGLRLLDVVTPPR